MEKSRATETERPPPPGTAVWWYHAAVSTNNLRARMWGYICTLGDWRMFARLHTLLVSSFRPPSGPPPGASPTPASGATTHYAAMNRNARSWPCSTTSKTTSSNMQINGETHMAIANSLHNRAHSVACRRRSPRKPTPTPTLNVAEDATHTRPSLSRTAVSLDGPLRNPSPKLWPGTPAPRQLRTGAVGRVRLSPDGGCRP